MRGRIDDRLAGLRIDAARPVDLHDRLGRDELPRRRIEHVEEAVLGRLHNDVARAAGDRHVGGHDRAGAGIIPVLARDHLIVPGIGAGFSVQRDDRADEQIVALALAAIMPGERRAVAGAHVNEIGLRIVSDRIPRIGAAAELPILPRPGLGGHRHDRVRGLMVRPLRGIARRSEEFPELLARVGIIGRDEAAHAEVAARIADHHHSVEHARRARDRVGHGLVVERAGGPHRLASRDIEPDQPSVERGDDRLALPQGQPARDRLAAGIAPHFARNLRIVGPQFPAGARVVGGGDVPRADIVEHAIGIKRRRLDPAIGVEIVIPGKADLIDIARIDLGERAEALRAVGAAVAQPAIGLLRGIGQPRGIHAFGLALRERAARKRKAGGR
jgi:hypothetical protein